MHHSQFNNNATKKGCISPKKIRRQTKRRNRDKPFIVSASVLGAGTHWKASAHTSYLDSQEMVRALTSVLPSPVTDQAQVRAASIVHHTRIVYCERKSHNFVKRSQFTAAGQIQTVYCSAGGLYLSSNQLQVTHNYFVNRFRDEKLCHSPIGCL